MSKYMDNVVKMLGKYYGNIFYVKRKNGGKYCCMFLDDGLYVRTNSINYRQAPKILMKILSDEYEVEQENREMVEEFFDE